MLSNVGSSFLSTYLEANKKLIQTTVIKSNAAASITNDNIVKTYGTGSVDLHDPSTWKYYMNLAGKRHFSDTPVEIISLDTQEPMEFTVENLLTHSATRKAYLVGSRYFYSLLRSYPTQESLIRGVIYPASISDAINATDGQILAYQKDLVEEQEVTLIDELQRYYQMFLSRYNISGYQATNSYFTLSLYAVMAIQSLGHLLNLRQKRCHTNEAHSFHIRAYLASHSKLDRYLPYLTLEQQLYLYRNIRYIDHHNGSTAQFEELVKNILIKRSIPLSQFSVRQLSQFDENNYPLVKAKRSVITDAVNSGVAEYIELDDVFAKERPLTNGNPDYLDLHQSASSKKFRNNSSTVTQTKVLESSLIDYSDAVPDPLIAVLVRQWSHMATHGLYNAQVYYTDPTTGEAKNLSAKDALSYVTYLEAMRSGVVFDKVPGYTILKYRKAPKPNLDDILAGIPSNRSFARRVVTQLWTEHVTIPVCISTDHFNAVATDVYKTCLKEWFVLSNTNDLDDYGYVKAALSKMYGSERSDGASETMEHFLFRNRLNVYNYTSEQAQSLIRTVVEAATGYAVDTRGQLRYVQKQLLSLLTQLSSYSIQIVSDVNDSALLSLNWPAVRLSRVKSSANFSSYTDVDVRFSPTGGRFAVELNAPATASVQLQPGDFATTYTGKLNCRVDLMGHLSFEPKTFYFDAAAVRTSEVL